jgi:hypothetical protein
VNFEHYVAGKTIAVVGPAPLPYDQSAEIEAHDLVYRPGHSPAGGWYGERTDIVYLNGQLGREILNVEYQDVRRRIEAATWWVYKAKGRAYRPEGFQRIAHIAPGVRNPNAITGILWDLTHFHPASITVYGADLYAGGPGNAYHADYDRRDDAGQGQGIILHRPWEQMRAHRAVHATGLIAGDDRYIAAVTMPDEQYQAVIDSWQAAQAALT